MSAILWSEEFPPSQRQNAVLRRQQPPLIRRPEVQFVIALCLCSITGALLIALLFSMRK